MATSGSIDYIVDRDAIITEALEQLGVLGEGDSPTAAQLSSSARTLNMMIKAWQGEGSNLFTLQRTYFLLQKDTREYTLTASGAHFTNTLVRTEVKTAASSGASAIDVDSITGISDADNIGVELDDGTLQWTTVNGAPSGDTVTLTASLTDDVSVDATVYVYTSKANRPIRIDQALVRDGDDYDNTVDIIARPDYFSLSDKTSTGEVTQIFYDPQVAAPMLHVWPTPNDVDHYLVAWTVRTIEDFDAASDDADYPQEWYMAIALNLAVALSNKYGISSSKFNRLSVLAETFKGLAEATDRTEYIQFYPETR